MRHSLSMLPNFKKFHTTKSRILLYSSITTINRSNDGWLPVVRNCKWFSSSSSSKSDSLSNAGAVGNVEKNNKKVKLWGGRFSGETDPLMEKFNASIGVDKRMWKEDLLGSMAYANALYRTKLLTKEENDKMQIGLKAVMDEWKENKFVIKDGDEDIHTANERRLTELVGSEIGGKLHTGRSRNDQCVTDFKLWLKGNVPVLVGEVKALFATIVERLESNSHELDVIISGYTHLQQAQPVRWAHYLLSYAFMFKRDVMRLTDSLKYIDSCPLGSGAIAGHSFFSPEQRQTLAQELGFRTVTENSMDAVSDRDYVVDFLYDFSIISMHLSRFSEDLIIYNSKEFGLVEMSDLYSTGSSLMPQKKNPDACEIMRGKAGEAYGSLISFLVTLKGLPMTYNKDLQDDKKIVFRTFDDVMDCVNIMTRVIATIKVHQPKTSSSDDSYATDLADYLVRKGVPFRKTHHIAGEAVQLAEKQGSRLSKLSLAEYKKLHPLFEEDVHGIFNLNSSVEKKNAEGSTSRRAVLEQMSKLKTWLNEQ